jgi:hypothetical protein
MIDDTLMATRAATRADTWRRYVVDGLLTIAILIVASLWGTHYWHASWAAGRQPFFYQEYFEPAVMTACGRGFVMSVPTVAGMNDFLMGKRDRFDCGEIPPSATVRDATLQGAARYLMLYLMWSVAAAWRLLGISWSGLGPFAGVLYGAAVAISYGIFRLGMGRLLALGGTLMFAVSPIHLTELPHVRDYAKAPFALACLLILGVMVARKLRTTGVLVLSALYGAIAGIGYGFRSDLLICLPPFFVTLATFMPEGAMKNLRRKAVAALLCVTAFALTAWPILSAALHNGSCMLHFVLLGLTNTFTDNLRLIPGPYDWGHNYADRWVYATIVAYGERRHPELGLIHLCSRAYDAVGLEYFVHIAKTFPADLITRGFASILGIIRQALWLPPPLPGFAPALYLWRARLIRHLPGTGLLWVAAAILVATGTRGVRVGLFLLFCLLYFGGYPALQFHPRHEFHLELVPWWAMGFVVSQAVRSIWRWLRSDHERTIVEWVDIRRICSFALSCTAVLAACFLIARVAQETIVRRMLEAYIGAPKHTVDYVAASAGTLHRIQMRTGQVYPYEFLEIQIRTAACGPSPSVTIRYEPQPDAELSRTVVLQSESDSMTVTRVFAPVYEFFQGVEFSDERAGCVAGIYRIADVRPFDLLMNATLRPGWQSESLHQRLDLSRGL